MSEQKPRLIDQLPIEKHTLFYGDMVDSDICPNQDNIEVVKVEDVENFLLKFTKPDVLQKIVKSLMFGHKLNLEDVLK